MSAEPVREPFAEQAHAYAERICGEHGLPETAREFATWLRAAWYAGYDAGLTRASRLLDRDIKLTEAP